MTNKNISWGSRVVRSFTVLCLLGGLGITPAFGVGGIDIYWNAATDNWFNNSNWSPSSVPTSLDTAYIDNGGTAQIASGGSATSRGAYIGISPNKSGSVTVDGAGSSWVISAEFDVAAGGTGSVGTLEIRNGGYVSNYDSYIGDGSGSDGSVVVDGTGSTWDNAYRIEVSNGGTGSLEISNGGVVTTNEGYISFSTGSGSVTVDGAGSTFTNTGFLVVAQNGTGTLTISNDGLVNVNGLLTLGPATGTLNIGAGAGAGILNTAEVAAGAGTATLNFNHTDSAYYFTDDGTSSGTGIVISGVTSVNHTGGGSTVLTGTNTYTGLTTINAGTLRVNGSIVSDTTVNSGGTLGGTGTVGNVTLAGGTFAPGNSIGTTTVDGDVDFSGGGIYQVEVDANGNSDLIDVTGTATLTGGSVRVQAASGDYQPSTDYTILSATGGLVGSFDSVTSNLAFLAPTLNYDANNVYLNLVRNTVSFTNVATTPNQAALANVLAFLEQRNIPATQDLINALLLLSDAQARHAYESLGGVQHAGLMAVTPQLGRMFQKFLANRLGGSHRFAGLDNSSLQGLNAGDPMYGDRGAWMEVYGTSGDIDSSRNASGMDYDSWGLTIGVDGTFGENLVLGIAASYADSNMDGRGFDADADSYQLATYAGWQNRGYYLNGQVELNWHQFDSTRQVVIGAASATASADYDADQITVAMEGGKAIDLSPVTTVKPFVGLSYTYLDRDGFTETGAGAANLVVRSEDEESIRSQLGLRLGHGFSTANGGVISGNLSAAWVHEFADNESAMQAGFSAAPTATFRVTAPELDRDRLALGADLTGNLSENTQLSVRYIGELADSDDHHGLSATLRILW